MTTATTVNGRKDGWKEGRKKRKKEEREGGREGPENCLCMLMCMCVSGKKSISIYSEMVIVIIFE